MAWTLQNTASGIAVTPDRSEVYVGIPRINSVAVVNLNTNTVRQLVPVAAQPGGLAIVPDPAAAKARLKLQSSGRLRPRSPTPRRRRASFRSTKLPISSRPTRSQ